MAVTLAEGLVKHRVAPSLELVMRAMRQFDELPTLRLTPEQARRLLDVDRETCAAVFEELEHAGFVTRDHSGQYMKLAQH